MKRISQPVTITLSPMLYKLADKIAAQEGRTRSEFVREAIRTYALERSWKKLQDLGAQKAKELGLKEEDIERLIDEGRV